MSPAGRRTSAFYKQRKRQQRIHQAQTISFLVFCLVVIGLGVYKAGHTSGGAPDQKTTVSATIGGSSHGATTTSPPQTAVEDVQLKNIITAWSQKYSYATTVSVQEVTGPKRSANLRATDSIVTASTFKLYVAYGVLHGVEQGTYKLSGTASNGKSISTNLSNMILNSDNAAARTLGFMIGWPQLDNLLASQGMTHTDTNNYVGTSTAPVGDKKSTAEDLATFLRKLYAGELMNPTNTQLLINLLEKQNYRSGIPAGVPSGIAVADKPGWLTPADGIYEYVQNDAGIIYGPKSTYILVITTGARSMQSLANLSQQVYAYLES